MCDLSVKEILWTVQTASLPCLRYLGWRRTCRRTGTSVCPAFLAVGGGDLTLTGGSERTVFKFQVEVERLSTTLLYEDQDSKPLALAQIDDVRFNLSVHPDTLHLTTALGNLKAQDGQLSEVCCLPYLRRANSFWSLPR